jgi:hypothetical protein
MNKHTNLSPDMHTCEAFPIPHDPQWDHVVPPAPVRA